MFKNLFDFTHKKNIKELIGFVIVLILLEIGIGIFFGVIGGIIGAAQAMTSPEVANNPELSKTLSSKYGAIWGMHLAAIALIIFYSTISIILLIKKKQKNLRGYFLVVLTFILSTSMSTLGIIPVSLLARLSVNETN